jgi:hypothetical protein
VLLQKRHQKDIHQLDIANIEKEIKNIQEQITKADNQDPADDWTV